MVLELRLDAGLVADQQKSRIRVADQGDRGPGDDHARSVVSAHGVERYGDCRSHLCADRKNVAGLGRMAGRAPRSGPEHTQLGPSDNLILVSRNSANYRGFSCARAAKGLRACSVPGASASPGHSKLAPSRLG